MGRTFSVLFSGWVLVIAATMISLQGCYQDDTCGPFNSWMINSIESVLYEVNDRNQDQYNLIVYRGGEVSYDSLLIEFDLIVETVSHSAFGLTSSFACSPVAPSISVAQISITSNADYNPDHSAGKNLIDIFDIQTDLSTNSSQNLASYFEENAGVFYGEQRYFLSILTPPDDLGKHKFQIQFTLQDSSKISFLTDEMLISK